MKRFIKKSLILGALLILLMLALNIIGVKTGNIYKDGAAQVCEKKRQLVREKVFKNQPGKDNVLFMGTSRILAGIIPAYFDELNGGKTSSYNLAFPALTISSCYFVLEEYLQKNPPPQYIVIAPEISRCNDCSTVNYYAVQGLTRLSEIVSLFKNSNTKSVIFNYIYPFRMYKYFTVQYLKDSLLNPAAIRKLQNKSRTILERMTENRGYYFIEEQAVFDGEQEPEEFAPKDVNKIKKGIDYDPFDDPYTEKFFDLAFDNRIIVLLIQPAFRENQYAQYTEIPRRYEYILKRYPNVTIAPEGWKMKLYDYTLFSDPTHLNKKGARKYTEIIFKEWTQARGLF